ncbi:MULTISPECIES: hypothetical protein [Pseudomonas]|uniref:Uncharacterized protein n=1 Tax=Pseudomonas syringae pv. syringae (strain B728a) TaxID=205918 RepID=Q4ZN30_PSEU2|nr:MULTISPECIES: hypothetical protein [Pseudomonas]AAY39442.1 conserved hypothetical protein [Pseudomonas syringae pv. syringae B728a]AVB27742.1 hypothetical protein BKC06_022985 [Pseudomonas syringae pv. syringae]KPB20403.1 Uncharacterized protein AC518_3982 [Pseudomonas syringae pv. syringae]KTB81859.1 hypothetical protein AO069_26030 [Pseudomonas syringae pv. syringae PD2774]KWS07914.1 hypothetical protein AL063_22300 [Pseudomonas syringae pv. syringae]
MKQELDAVVVNAGCLMFFPEPQPVSLKNDVLDSMLYVQLAASKQHSKFAEPEKWNETRLAAAQRFGWLPSANEHVSQPLPAESAETVWSCMARALAPFVSADTLLQAESFMRRVGNQSVGSEALDLLRSQSVQSGLNHAGRLQVSVVLQMAFVDTRQNLKLAQFQFATRQPLPSAFLFEVIEPKNIYGNIAVTVYAMQLFEQVYSQFRDGIDTALSSKRAGLIMSLGGSPDV